MKHEIAVLRPQALDPRLGLGRGKDAGGHGKAHGAKGRRVARRPPVGARVPVPVMGWWREGTDTGKPAKARTEDIRRNRVPSDCS
ncbi:uncharacterized protein PY1_contig-04-423 [Novosphingobium sp. PY1]|nr:uncharacterized protein PY1_contig-04-423 [Novosphingobium sp. PY1]